NQSCVMGALLGKFFIALHRYIVLRQVAVSEKIWPARLVRLILAIQLILPLAISGACFSIGYVHIKSENGWISYLVPGQGLIIHMFITNVFIGVYVIISILLTFLSSRKLSALKKRLGNQSIVVRQQKNMFVVVAVCSLSHLLKAGHQSYTVIMSMNGAISRSVFETWIWPAVG
ncbi:hypothetical protein PMAYCL1PPCAC_26014, partial [Pristionchus mayeri]